MIKEILGDDFMDCRKVMEICTNRGISHKEIMKRKRTEGIGTTTIMNKDGEDIWLWYDPSKIIEKYKFIKE